MNKKQYTYFIFLTPLGKGYGCFSIDKKRDNDVYTYNVSASYCHPNDRNMFVKKISRKLADVVKESQDKNKFENLKTFNQSPLVEIVTSVEEPLDNFEIVKCALKNDLFCPGWASRSLKNGLYLKGLTFDCLSKTHLVIKLCDLWLKDDKNHLVLNSVLK